jgi:hypothetical protein
MMSAEPKAGPGSFALNIAIPVAAVVEFIGKSADPAL